MNKGLRWKETIAGVEAPNLMVVETQLPAGRNQTFATPTDIIACLRANPEAAGQVLLALESQYIAGETAKHIARASQAERSLATLRELIHTASGLDDHRYSAEQMVKEMAERWQGASDDCEKAEQALATVAGERDALKAKLAEAERERDEARAERDVATKEEDRAKLNLAKAAEQIEALRAQLAKTEAVVDAAREDAQHCPHACSPPCPFDRAVARTRAALRALDSPVVAGTDSGGSGAPAGPMGSYRGGRNPEAQGSADGTDPEERRDYARAQNAKLSVECDDLRAQLTAVERERDAARSERDTLGRRVEDAQAALNECGAGFTGQPEATRIRDLRAKLAKTARERDEARDRAERAEVQLAGCGSAALGYVDPPAKKGDYGWSASYGDVLALRAQLAKTERVVEAARQHLRCDLTDTESISAEHALQNALRALDSPVGVAATACDHKRQRCENDHAVCRDCGAVNRAVTGVVDWGPPETARDDGSTGAVACPVCRCLKVGHHPGGCEGAGGNCGCTERFPEG